MPFTLSHPAAILPLHRFRRSSLLPLIAGSIAPDLPYFIPQAGSARLPDSHALFGILVISPVAAFLWLALVRVLRRSLARPLPGRHRVLVQRALDDFGGTFGDWVWALPAVLIGILLHVGLDSFTHAYGWPVRHWPPLRTPIDIAGEPVAVFHILQWVGSFLGLAVIAVVYRRALRALPPVPTSGKGSRTRLIGVLMAAVAAIGAAIHRIDGVEPLYRSLYWLTLVGLTRAISTFAVLYVVLGLYLGEVEARQS